MSKFLVTVGAGTGPGTVIQSGAQTALLNGKPLVTVGSIATHPYGSDVVIEGLPTVLLNGKPLAFSTAKTAMGGCLIPNSTAQIVPAEPEVPLSSYTGLKEAARMEDSGTHKPDKSTSVKLESTFAMEQLISFAKTEGLNIFIRHIEEIFDTDINPAATEKLYDSLKGGSFQNPPIKVCINLIHGRLEAAYHTKEHAIYVTESIIRKAAQDNEIRHKLMTALIEEFGHHIDYLLREVYDKNVKKDSKGDEGARFAYQGMYKLFYINPLKSGNTPFAQAEIDGTAIELKWEYEEVFEALTKYTKERQQGTDDHVGDFEGFKVEDLSGVWGGGFGHENIQKRAVRDVFNTQAEDYINILYYGNWMRDYSQIICPAAISALTGIDRQKVEELSEQLENSISRFSAQSAQRLRDAKRDATVAARVAKDADIVKEVTELSKKMLEEDEIGKEIVQGTKAGEALFTVDSSVVFLREIAAVMAFKHFNKEVKIKRSPENQTEKKWREMLRKQIPGFYEELGISTPWDHFDNPFGSLPLEKELDRDFDGQHFCGEIKDPAKDARFKDTYQTWRVLSEKGANPEGIESFSGFDFWQVDKETGIKNHIRTTKKSVKDKQEAAHVNIVYEYICRKLEKVMKPGANNDPQNLVALGGVLHIMQDFYAHSNYSETYLASKWFDGIITWTSSDRHYKDFSNNAKYIPHYAFSKNVKEKIISDKQKELRQEEGFSNITLKEHGHFIADQYGRPVYENLLYRKGLYTPITTGTYNDIDMVSTALEMLKDKKASIEFDPEKDEYIEEGILTINDIFILEVLEFIDKNRAENSEESSGSFSFLEAYHIYLNLRDIYARNYGPFSIQGAVKTFGKVLDLFGLKKIIDEIVKMGRNLLVHLLLKILAKGIVEYQLIMAESLKSVLSGKYPPFDNPSHTMLAKDDPRHPINSIAGELAIEATKRILERVQSVWDGNGKAEDVKKEIEGILTHPMQTDIFDHYVIQWGIRNPHKVLFASVSSYIIEGIRRSISWADSIKRTIERTLDWLGMDSDDHSNEAYMRIQEYMGHDIEELLGQMNINLSVMRGNVREAIEDFRQTTYFELDAEKMWEFYKLYYPHYKERWERFTEEDFLAIARIRLGQYCDSLGDFAKQATANVLIFWENLTWGNIRSYAESMARKIKGYYSQTTQGLGVLKEDLSTLYEQSDSLIKSGNMSREEWESYWEELKETGKQIKRAVEEDRRNRPVIEGERTQIDFSGLGEQIQQAKERAAEAFSNIANDFSENLEQNIPQVQADVERILEQIPSLIEEYTEEADSIDISTLANDLMDAAISNAGRVEENIIPEIRREARQRIAQASQKVDEFKEYADGKIEQIPAQSEERFRKIKDQIAEAKEKANREVIERELRNIEQAGKGYGNELEKVLERNEAKLKKACDKVMEQLETIYKSKETISEEPA